MATPPPDHPDPSGLPEDREPLDGSDAAGRAHGAGDDLEADLDSTLRRADPPPRPAPAGDDAAAGAPDDETDRTRVGPARARTGGSGGAGGGTGAAGGKGTAGGTGSAARSGETAVTDPLVGTTLGGCQLEALLGRGAMGAVYRARQVRLARTVAVKVMRGDLLADRRAIQRFEQEAKTVGRFDSQYVVRIHDVGEERGLHYLIMEFVAGVNLRQQAQQSGGRIDFGEATRLLRQACDGLEEAQRVGVLHRDIKPDNLMLGERGELKIADFGIAKPIHDDLQVTMTAELMGTPLYMSPEQCRGEKHLDFRSDMFSLGATFFHLLTGEPPVKANSVYELIETKTRIDCLSLSKVLPEMAADNPLSRVIEKMTALERGDRYADYGELRADLDRIERGERVQAEPPKPRPRQRTAPARSRAVPVVIAVLVLGGGAAAWALTSGGAAEPADRVVTPEPEPNPRPNPQPVDRARELKDIRGRFRANGPSRELQRDLEAVAPETAADRAEHRALSGLLDRALAARAKLREIELRRPVPKPPFDDTAAFLAEVDAVAVADADADRDLRGWLEAERERVRSVEVLRTAARAALIDAWASWNSARRDAVLDADAIQTLREKLQAIRAGGDRLCALFDTDVATLRLPVDEWSRAEQELSAPPVDLRARLDDLRARFRGEGPSTALRGEVEAIQSNTTSIVEDRRKLLDAMDLAQRVRGNLDTARLMRPAAPTVPFQKLESWYERIDGALGDALRADDADLTALVTTWRAAERAEDAFGAAAVAALEQAWTECERDLRAARAAGDASRLQAMQARVEPLREGRARLLVLFPALAAQIEQAMPAERATTLVAELQAAATAVGLQTAVTATGRLVQGAAGLAGWQRVRDRVHDELGAHAAAVAEQAGAADATELRQAIDALEREVSARDRAARALDEAIGRLVDGDLTAAAAVDLSAPAFGDEARALSAAIGDCGSAFEALRQRADLDGAGERLAAAARRLDAFGEAMRAAQQRTADWQRLLGEVRKAASGLVPIAGGDSGKGVIDAFFVAPLEVTRADWLPFVRAVDAAWKATAGQADGARLDRLAADFGVRPPTADVVTRLLRGQSALESDPQKPIDGISQYAAAMYAHWRRRDLPTLAEWTMAALGPAPRANRFPWGDQWTLDAAVRSQSTRELVAADQGGRTWGDVRRGDVRHLVGNAAEWLEAPSDAENGALAGGSYRDTRGELERAAMGEPFEKHREATNLGYGLRTMLRPREVFGDAWPR
ncbi:MAG: protein kinase [Planctomycetota bacterium]